MHWLEIVISDPDDLECAAFNLVTQIFIFLVFS